MPEGELNVCHSDYKHPHQRLISVIHQFSESEK